MTSKKKNPAGRRGWVAVQSNVVGMPNQYISDAVDLVLGHLEGVRKAGKGWSARCPAHPDRRASLSICAGTDGRILIHCFAGCAALDIVRAVGLELHDLFPVRIPSEMNYQQRIELRQRARDSKMMTAVVTLELESAIVSIAVALLLQGLCLDWDDYCRLVTAQRRIADVQGVLRAH